MAKLESDKKLVSRREFLVGSGTVLAAGTLASCAPKTVTQPAPVPIEAESVGTEAQACGTYSWETVPDPIPASEIKEVIDADIVVIGAGIGGLPAACKAAELGANVHVLEKSSTHGKPRGGHTAYNTEISKAKGVEVDPDLMVEDLMAQSAFINSKQALYKLYVEKSGEVTDWLHGILKAGGLEIIPGPFTTIMRESYVNQYVWVLGEFIGGMGNPPPVDWMETLYKATLDKGVVFHFNTVGKRLIRAENGRVTGVIATNESGDYVQYNASKGVILATGDYGRDPEMMGKFYPAGLRTSWNFCNPNNTGDGQKMAMWVGADMDVQGSGCIFTGQSTTGKSLWPASALNYGWPYAPAVATGPVLWVDIAGNRCMNEELNITAAGNQILTMPPEARVFGVWDNAWATKIPSPISTMFSVDTPEQVEIDVKEGITLKADTLEELAEKMEVETDIFKETVARYNELCAAGKDEDFHKSPAWMTPIDTAPFYAASTGTNLCTTLGGIKISPRVLALDKKGREIPGLYVTGNTASYYGANYPTGFFGTLSGHIMTLSYVAVLDALS